MSKKKKIVVAIILIISIIQFIPLSRENSAINLEKDFIAIVKPSSEIETMIRTSCYDCHSNETKYPWYTNVAPMSWWINHHIEEGKEHLNFSSWGDYSEKKRIHKLDECIELIEEEEMPLHSYTWIYHKEADLTQEQRETLINWFKSIQ